MLKIIASFLLAFSVGAHAGEIIKIYSPYSPGHSATPAMLKILEHANSSQQTYQFVMEFKPGGNQLIAVKSIDPENSMAIIAPAYVEHILSGKLNENDYVPVWALGDACWAVIANKTLTGAREVVVGGVGYGNASHLTALALGEKYHFDVRYIVFKSNNDALINMAGGNGVEMVIDKYENYQSLRSKNSKLTMIAASCPARLPQEPRVKTLHEQGITAPLIFNILVAHKDMPRARRASIGAILNASTISIGSKEIYNLSAMRPPVFDSISTEQFYLKSVNDVKNLQKIYKTKIDLAIK